MKAYLRRGTARESLLCYKEALEGQKTKLLYAIKLIIPHTVTRDNETQRTKMIINKTNYAFQLFYLNYLFYGNYNRVTILLIAKSTLVVMKHFAFPLLFFLFIPMKSDI